MCLYVYAIYFLGILFRMKVRMDTGQTSYLSFGNAFHNGIKKANSAFFAVKNHMKGYELLKNPSKINPNTVYMQRRRIMVKDGEFPDVLIKTEILKKPEKGMVEKTELEVYRPFAPETKTNAKRPHFITNWKFINGLWVDMEEERILKLRRAAKNNSRKNGKEKLSRKEKAELGKKIKVRAVSGSIISDYHKYLNRRKAPNWNSEKERLSYCSELINELVREPKYRPRISRLDKILTFGLAKRLMGFNDAPDNRPVREGFWKVLRHNLKGQSKKA